MTCRSGPLIAIPFNALSRRALTPNCGQLWQQALRLFKAEDTERKGPEAQDSYFKLYFDRRYDERGWPLERIGQEREKFLSSEMDGAHTPPYCGPHKTTSYFALTAHEQKIVGEFCLSTPLERPNVAIGFDYIAPHYRHQQFGSHLLALRLKLAAEQGFQLYRAMVGFSNTASLKRLERLEKLGQAKVSGCSRRRDALGGILYSIDLAAFR